jgi:hypothetical protein
MGPRRSCRKCLRCTGLRTLEEAERWRSPSATSPEAVSAGQAVVFEEGGKSIKFKAETDSAFVLGSAVKHPYELVTGHYSVHTTADALRQGEEKIAALGRRLYNQGVLGSKPVASARSS